ncbi:MAG TPA: hypothetical protein VFY87_27395, partial [Geminicoccaceae bacterium]|nr:hypothetical protein [Geminicoccaceae bacterium]
MLDRVAKLGFLLGVAFFVYLAGIVTGWRQLPPANYLGLSADAARDWTSNWRSYLGVEPVRSLYPARGPGAGVVVHDPERAQPGVTLLTGLWGPEMGLSLRAPDGRELHHWRAVFSEVWPVAAHLPREAAPANDWDATLHGAVLLPGGDVVF